MATEVEYDDGRVGKERVEYVPGWAPAFLVQRLVRAEGDDPTVRIEFHLRKRCQRLAESWGGEG